MKHSPEPWTTDGICVYDADHKLVATLSGFGHEAIATRRLIVAAPALLEALQRLDTRDCTDERGGPWDALCTISEADAAAIRAAISQATEKQT